jgi:ArsR family transcriptional regulator, virulence genes transcriptional regulator
MKKEVLEFHAEFCKTFSSPKRLEILCILKEGEMTVSDITRKLGIPKAGVSQHLTVMRMMGILKARRNGTNIYYKITNAEITQACSLMQDALERLIEGVATISKEKAIAAMRGDK